MSNSLQKYSGAFWNVQVIDVQRSAMPQAAFGVVEITFLIHSCKNALCLTKHKSARSFLINRTSKNWRLLTLTLCHTLHSNGVSTKKSYSFHKEFLSWWKPCTLLRVRDKQQNSALRFTLLYFAVVWVYLKIS